MSPGRVLCPGCGLPIKVKFLKNHLAHCRKVESAKGGERKE